MPASALETSGKGMSRAERIIHESDEHFVCAVCGSAVGPPAHGTRNRNHCPRCLCSVHVDLRPGDRRSSCHGIMRPIAVWSSQKECSIIHRCEKCGMLSTNRVGPDDDENAILALAAHPLTRLPFPLDTLDQGRLS